MWKDLLFRRGNLTNAWMRSPGLSLTAELLEPAINGVSLGSPVEALSFLGRSSSNFRTPLLFADLGLSIDNSTEALFQCYEIVFEDPDDNAFQSFGGTITVNRRAVAAADLVQTLGEPYWLDIDEYERLSFYEYPHHEVQLEESLEGVLQRIIVTNEPLMARADQRESYGVDRPWPPAHG